MVVSEAAFWRERPYLAVAITHFFVDVLNGGRTLLVAVLAVSMGLSNAQVALVLLLYNIGNALMQPLFGSLADRMGPRWLVVGGMGWMILFFCLTAVPHNWLALVALTIAGLGSGAFHPAGTMVGSQVSQPQRNRATAVFFMAGQLGLFVGPIVTGLLLDEYGRLGYTVLPLLSLLAFVSGWQWLAGERGVKTAGSAPAAARRASWMPQLTAVGGGKSAVALVVVLLSYSTVSISTISFAPKLYTDLGHAASFVGWLTSVFTLGTVIGGMVGGFVADRLGGKLVIFISLLGFVLPGYFYIPADGVLRVVLLFLAGFFNGMPHSILVLRVQSLFPNRQAMASGLALGFMFFSGAVGSYFLGVIADEIGLGLTLQGTAVLPLLAFLAALFL